MRSWREESQLRQTVAVKWRRPDVDDFVAGQAAIEMREERIASGGLPFQFGAEVICVQGKYDQILPAVEPAPGRLNRLIRRREMNEPVRSVDSGSLERPL